MIVVLELGLVLATLGLLVVMPGVETGLARGLLFP
jgi:hypothetical protein